MKNLPMAISKDIVVQSFEDEILVYNLVTNKAVCLNKISALIWKLCDGTNTVREISQKMGKDLKESISEEYIWLALNQLKKEGLIEESGDITDKYQGLSRREVIRKIGYGSMIALPIVSSIVAPTAASAQSGGIAPGTFASCVPNPAICASNHCLAVGGGAIGVCCIPGATDTVSPNNDGCRTDQAAANAECCSASASPTGGAPCPPGTSRFVCDPYP